MSTSSQQASPLISTEETRLEDSEEACLNKNLYSQIHENNTEKHSTITTKSIEILLTTKPPKPPRLIALGNWTFHSSVH